MENTKIGNKEAIALLVTITFNHIILNICKSIIDFTASSSLLNILFIGLIALIYGSLICYLLNKFPTFDLIDISHYLGGNFLKWFIGLAYIAYFIFFAGNLLHMFSSCLQIIYFPLTKLFYIVLFFIISAVLACNMKYNAIYRSNFIIFTLVLASSIFLFISDIPFYTVEKIYPIFGNGLFTTFVSGICNLFAFQCLGYIYFMPPILKDSTKIKKITITSIILSCIFLLICTAIILFLFNSFIDTDELIPLYSASKYIEFGSFFRKLDSIFILIWIISLISYLSITLNFSSNILTKLTNSKKRFIYILILAFVLFFASIWQKNYVVSTFCTEIVYKYSFFILIIGISFLVLALSALKQKNKEVN